MKSRYILPMLLMFAACNRPECKNTNQIFDQNAPGSKAYNDELVQQINKRGKDKLNYWISKYQQLGDKEYMLVNVQDNELCAVALMDITGNDQLDNYRKVKGMSYGGAGLRGLIYDMVKDSDGAYRFVFKDVETIVD